MLERTKPSTAAASDRRAIFILVGIASVVGLCACSRNANEPSAPPSSGSSANKADATVELSTEQLKSIKIEPTGTHAFTVQKRTIGSIDFDNKLYFDNALGVQVFPSVEGTIAESFAELGDQVLKDQTLFVIRTANQRTMDVRSPITGQVTAVNATKGMLVQPGKAPAPYAIADVSTKWMLASVLESDSPLIEPDQAVEVRVAAYPDRVFEGKVSKIYPTVDANTHRFTVRATVADPANELRAGMLANIVINVKRSLESIAVPEKGIVREPDGTMTAWITADKHRFTERVIQLGLRQDGYAQILSGLGSGELVVTEGAVFLSNMLQAPPTD